jgi:hypothetical protein
MGITLLPPVCPLSAAVVESFRNGSEAMDSHDEFWEKYISNYYSERIGKFRNSLKRFQATVLTRALEPMLRQRSDAAVRDRLTRATSLALRKNRSASGYAPLAAASLGLLTYGGILARIPLRPNSATRLTRRSSALRPVPSASAQCRRVPKCRELTLPDRPRLGLLPRLRS